jgi:hypothetical protein
VLAVAAGLVIAAVAFAVLTTAVPAHATFGAGTLRCGTVLRPARATEIGYHCAEATAHQLHTAAVIAIALAGLAFAPAVIRPNRTTSLVYLVVLFLVAALAVAWVAAFDEYSVPIVRF